MPINFLLFYYMNLISLNSSDGEGVADPPPPSKIHARVRL